MLYKIGNLYRAGRAYKAAASLLSLPPRSKMAERFDDLVEVTVDPRVKKKAFFRVFTSLEFRVSQSSHSYLTVEYDPQARGAFNDYPLDNVFDDIHSNDLLVALYREGTTYPLPAWMRTVVYYGGPWEDRLERYYNRSKKEADKRLGVVDRPKNHRDQSKRKKRATPNNYSEKMSMFFLSDPYDRVAMNDNPDLEDGRDRTGLSIHWDANSGAIQVGDLVHWRGMLRETRDVFFMNGEKVWLSKHGYYMPHSEIERPTR